MRVRVVLLGLCLAFSSTLILAGIESRPFDDPAKEALYSQLINDLRCLVCQNQNLADSNAELAVDLRRQVHEMITRGDSGAQVSDYMVARYGEFVLYRPPLSGRTLVLWLGPTAALLLALVVAWRVSRGRKSAERGNVSEADIVRARDLLNK